jgi:lambda repressor-like predicted transcriptional regulator
MLVRRAVGLRQEGWSISEIAAALGMSENEVKKALRGGMPRDTMTMVATAVDTETGEELRVRGDARARSDLLRAAEKFRDGTMQEKDEGQQL